MKVVVGKELLQLSQSGKHTEFEKEIYKHPFLPQGFESSREARAQADIKFTYVVSCQIYGQQKQRKEKEAADIALLLQRCYPELNSSCYSSRWQYGNWASWVMGQNDSKL